MAKSDYCIDVGMWYVNSRGTGTPDRQLDAIVPELKLIWDGYPAPGVRACNIVMTSQGGEFWGYNSSWNRRLNTRSKQEAHGFGEWILRLKEANEAEPGAPRYLKSLVFRPLWGLRKVRHCRLSQIQDMTARFLDFFAGLGDPKPRHRVNGRETQLTCSDLNLVRGYYLGDDFTAQAYDADWDRIVERVHSDQTAKGMNSAILIMTCRLGWLEETEFVRH